jgi:two-component system OmpR family response regulator
MRLLIIEDEADLLSSLAKALREERYAVDTAPDGEEGLYKAINAEYDLIILDVMLPVLDGWGILKKIRQNKNERIKNTPVLMLTARDAPRYRVRGLDLGADDYLIKPFDLDELFARVRALIRRAAGVTSNVMKVGSVRICTTARQVTLDGETVALTPREYELLLFLAMHRGEVVSRSALYEHLFDENENTLSNLLDVHVSNLRSKLGGDLILTRRGHGYCIE